MGLIDLDEAKLVFFEGSGARMRHRVMRLHATPLGKFSMTFDSFSATNRICVLHDHTFAFSSLVV
jgi:hypothetical protein